MVQITAEPVISRDSPRYSGSDVTQKQTARRRGRPHGDAAAVSRDQILNAAINAFANTGFEAMSIRALTRDLNVSHGLIHHYFSTKRDLWEACVDVYFRALRDKMIALAPVGDAAATPAEAAREFIRISVMLSARFPGCVRILLDEGAQGGERLDYLMTNYLDPAGRVWFEAIEALGEKSGVNPPDGRTLFFLITFGGTIPFCAPALASHFEGEPLQSDAAIERHANMVADMLVDGIRSRPGEG
ncbi:MAG: TetR/AcrR family transcriptional regulator [Pseudomonadota bacterium]